ncbi:MAG: hypothetical protein GY796_01140 [Chloroflexi bacterium]|nr:hypothetical protein [Chloroflexota bacterium]
MDLSTKSIEAINLLTGTNPESYEIYLDGNWIKTDCIVWQVSNRFNVESSKGDYQR